MNSACYTTFFNLSKSKINNFLQLQTWSPGNKINNAKEKSSNDWVTHFDLTISTLVQHAMTELKMPHQLISEENWQQGQLVDFNSSLVILDPIDGTNGFIKGSTQFALSLSIIEHATFCASWVWNFATNEEATTLDPLPNIESTSKIGLVSSTEWKNGLWKDQHLEVNSSTYQIQPCGSIAYKLLLLYLGQCRFVASKRPKNLWDIAAGTHLIQAKGFKLFCQKKEVLQFKKMKWEAPLLWCEPSEAEILHKLLFE